MASSMGALRCISLNERIMRIVYLSRWSDLRLLPGGALREHPGPSAGPGGSDRGEDLNLADVRCLKTLWAAGHLELDPVTFGQGLEALGLDGAVVDEDVLAAFLRDEPVTLRIVEPLHLSLCHSF